MANILGLVGVGVSGLALFCAILAMSLTLWQHRAIDGGGATSIYLNVGIWEYCVEKEGNSECNTIDSDAVELVRQHGDNQGGGELSDYQGVRATVFLGIIFTASAIVSAILVMIVLQTKKVLYFVAAGLNVAAGLFLMIAMAVYADRVAQDGYNLHVCFFSDIIAWVAALVGGGLFVGAKLTEKQ